MAVLHERQTEERAMARARLVGLAANLDEPTALQHRVGPLLKHRVGPLLTPAQRGRGHPGARP